MSQEEKDAGIDTGELEAEKHEIKKEVKITEKTVEAKAEGGHKFSSIEIVVLVILALMVGFILSYLIPRLLERLRPEPQVRYVPYHVPFIPPPPMRPTRRHRRRAAADVDPMMIARTPPELRRHNIWLDDKGEACLGGPTNFETWSVIRDSDGSIKDAFRVREGGEEDY